MGFVDAVAHGGSGCPVDQRYQVAVFQGFQLPVGGRPKLHGPEVFVAGLVNAVAVVVLAELEEYKAVAQAGFLLENTVEKDFGSVRGEAKAVGGVVVVGKEVQHANEPVPSHGSAHAVVGSSLGPRGLVDHGELHVGTGLQEGRPVGLDGGGVKGVQYNARKRAGSGHLDGAAQGVGLANVPQFDGAIFRGKGGKLAGLSFPGGVAGVELFGLAFQAPAGTAGGSAHFQDPIGGNGGFCGEMHGLAGAEIDGGGRHSEAFADFEVAVEVFQIGSVGGQIAFAGG